MALAEAPLAPKLMHPYLHDNVEGQIEQQVADEDAQHVGRKVPGPVDQSKEGAEDMRRTGGLRIEGWV